MGGSNMTAQELIVALAKLPADKLNKEVYFCYVDGYESAFVKINICEVDVYTGRDGEEVIRVDGY